MHVAVLSLSTHHHYACSCEWVPRILTAGNSSQELAEIFGTSDDEDTDDFPTDLTAILELSKPLSDIGGLLDTSDAKKFDASVFLNSIQESLQMENLSTTEKSTTSSAVEPGVGVANSTEGVKVESGGGKIKRETASSEEGVNEVIAPSEKEVKVKASAEKEQPSQLSSSGAESGGGSGSEEGGGAGGRPVRKSARLRSRMGLQSVAGTGTDKEEVKETIEKVGIGCYIHSTCNVNHLMHTHYIIITPQVTRKIVRWIGGKLYGQNKYT